MVEKLTGELAEVNWSDFGDEETDHLTKQPKKCKDIGGSCAQNSTSKYSRKQVKSPRKQEKKSKTVGSSSRSSSDSNPSVHIPWRALR